LAGVRDQPWTLVCFEAPHRLLAALQDVYEVLGDRKLAAACELTKMYEEVWRGTVSEALGHYNETRPRGEFTLVLAGAPRGAEAAWEEAQVRQALSELIGSGVSRRDAATAVARQAHWPRRRVYRLAAQQLPGEIAGGFEDD
jgi:16S rRNA (cytidine1402-2'-O)-methyltransferase